MDAIQPYEKKYIIWILYMLTKPQFIAYENFLKLKYV